MPCLFQGFAMPARPTLSLLCLNARLGAVLEDPEEDLEQGQQHLGLGDSCSSPVSAGISLLEGLLHLISPPGLLALPLRLHTLLLACTHVIIAVLAQPSRLVLHKLRTDQHRQCLHGLSCKAFCFKHYCKCVGESQLSVSFGTMTHPGSLSSRLPP